MRYSLTLAVTVPVALGVGVQAADEKWMDCMFWNNRCCPYLLHACRTEPGRDYCWETRQTLAWWRDCGKTPRQEPGSTCARIWPTDPAQAVYCAKGYRSEGPQLLCGPGDCTVYAYSVCMLHSGVTESGPACP